MDVEQYLNKFQTTTEQPTLEAMHYFMQKMGNPHLQCKVIHVAGTNGKGSVVEMLNRLLIDQGYQVGKYISPHLIRLNERICVNDQEITQKEMEEILIKLQPLIEEYNQTHTIKVKYFEVITCMAFIYFAQLKCDFVVLETGMGGTWDCTNIVQPILSIITSIGYDHMQLLGNTLKEIAQNKAGIIKQNSQTIFLEQENEDEQKEVLTVIQTKCKKENNQLHFIKRTEITNFFYNEEKQYLDYENTKQIATNLKGKIQIYNTAIVLKAVSILVQMNYKIEESKMRKSLQNVIHKARFEKLLNHPIVLFDGAHNKPAVLNFIENMKQYYANEKKVYIVSILKTKDYKTVLHYLLQDKEAIIIVTDGDDTDKYVSKEDLYASCKQMDSEHSVQKMNLKEAIQIALEQYTDRIISIVGSFYVYQKVQEIIQNERKQND